MGCSQSACHAFSWKSEPALIQRHRERRGVGRRNTREARRASAAGSDDLQGRSPAEGAAQLAQLRLERAAIDEFEQLEAASPAIASIGPSGVSIQLAVSSAVSRASPGVSPKTRANASRKPLSDSNPASRPASSVGDSLVQRAHRGAEAARALIGLERHAEAALERAAHLHRVEPARAQVVIAQADVGIALHLVDERRKPVRRRCGRRHRIADPARPVAAVQRVLDGRRELDVLRLRLPRAAGRSAEDPGRPHAGEEQALERSISKHVTVEGVT